ncbi:hypothetical protein LIER_04644 [Lithospermum erythrorhizon]|uniref:Uncharacterized protein n=1 Tax=Lithospermum erythrorhizon TaxID=34254 RepID=A0AAV3P269_LITER
MGSSNSGLRKSSKNNNNITMEEQCNNGTTWVLVHRQTESNVTSPQHPNVQSPHAIISDDWSPLDDGIKLSTNGNKASQQEVDLHIQRLLYGASRRKRLQVFNQICPQ